MEILLGLLLIIGVVVYINQKNKARWRIYEGNRKEKHDMLIWRYVTNSFRGSSGQET